MSSKEKKETATVGAELGEILNRPRIQFQVRSPAECARIAQNIFTLVEEHGFSYLERYSDLENVEECLSSSSPREWNQLAGGRALRFPLVLALLGQTERAREEFVKQYDYLKSVEDLLVKNYPIFVARVCQTLRMVNPMGEENGKIR